MIDEITMFSVFSFSLSINQSISQSIINVVVPYLQQWDRQCITVSRWSLKTNKSSELCEKPGQNEGSWCEEESGSKYLDRRRRRRACRELGPCPHDNSCVGCRGTELATSRLFCVEFDDIVEVCWPTLIKRTVHHGGNLELNSCLHRQ